MRRYHVTYKLWSLRVHLHLHLQKELSLHDGVRAMGVAGVAAAEPVEAGMYEELTR